MLLVISVELQKKDETLWQKIREKTKTFLAAEIIMEPKTRKETHTDKEKKDILLQFTSSKKVISFFAI